MNSEGQNLWDVIVIYAMSKIFYQKGKLHMNGAFKNKSVGESYKSERKVEHHPTSAKDQASRSVRQESTLKHRFLAML